MKDSLSLKPLQKTDFSTIVSWFEHHSFKQRLEGYFPVAGQLERVLKNSNFMAWVAFVDNKLVGMVEIERELDTGYILIMVAPDFQGKGFGKKILQLVITEDKIQALTSLLAYIKSDHDASKECFKAAGYQYTFTDEDGFELWKYTIKTTRLY